MASLDRATDSLAPVALAVVSLTIVVGIGGIVLAELGGSSYIDQTVNNETFNATSDPYTYTVGQVSGDSEFYELSEVTVYASESQSTELDYAITDASAGEIQVNSTVDSDLESVDYTYDQETTATTTLSDGEGSLSTFADFFQVIIVVAVAAVIFILLGALRRTGRNTMA